MNSWHESRDLELTNLEGASGLRFLVKLAEAGEFKTVIDRRYSLEQMAGVHSYVDTGCKKGNIIITLA